MKWRWPLGALSSRQRAIPLPSSPPGDEERATPEGERSEPSIQVIKDTLEAILQQQQTSDRQRQSNDDRTRRLARWAAIGTWAYVLISLGVVLMAAWTVNIVDKQWYAMRNASDIFAENNKIAREANERALRAYVLTPRLDLIEPRWGVRLVLRNSGATPATVTAYGVVPVRGAPPAGPEKCPPHDFSRQSVVLVPPKGEHAIPWYGPGVGDDIGWALEDRARNTIHLWGSVRYTDAFNVARASKFCFLLAGRVNKSNVGLFIHLDGPPNLNPAFGQPTAFVECPFCNSWE